jgi:hypothetical protein
VKQNGELLEGKPKNRSTRIIFGKVYTQSNLMKEGFGEHTALYRNADNTDGKVIKCVTGNCQPFDKNWIILSAYNDLKQLVEEK